jgi:hypothetical protein
MLSLLVQFQFVISSQNKSIILYTLAFVTVGTYIKVLQLYMLFLDP